MDDGGKRKRFEIQERINGAVDLGMGMMYVTLSAYAFRWPLLWEQYGKSRVQWLCGGAILYGGFRLYRGLMRWRSRS